LKGALAEMKVAVSATGETLDSQVDQRFGRALYFLIVDTDDESLEVLDNSANASAMGGAGLQTGQNVADKGVEWVLTGSVGPRAFSVLNAAGVKIGVGASGSVRDAIARLKEGGFTPMSADECGPQGIGKGGGMGRGRRFRQ
jgi:predicted Fe-Mo cluster-binding NifX family protein